MAGAPFVTVGGTLPTIRETEAPPNPQVVEMIARRRARRSDAVAKRSAPGQLMAVSVVMPALEMAQETGKLVVVAEEGRRAGPQGRDAARGGDRQGGRRSRGAGDGILAGVTAKTRRRGASRPHDRVAACSPAKRRRAASRAGADRQRRTDTVASAIAAAARRPSARPRRLAAMRISPKARRLAQEHGVDLSQSEGSGPGGEILADDILAAAQAG